MREDIDVTPEHLSNDASSTGAAPLSSTRADAGKTAPSVDHETPEIVEEVLVEEVSIDGMCGVY